MRNKRKSTARFWLLSALLHGLVFAGIFFTPAGQRVFKREERPLKPEIIRKGDELADVIDDLRDLAVVRLKARVAVLETGRKRMSANLDAMNRSHEPFAAAQIASAGDRLRRAGETTLRLQEEILHAARRAVESKEHGSDPMWRVFERNRAALVSGQEEIRRALLLTAGDEAELLALQEKTERAQMDAFEALSASVSAQNRLWNSTERLRSLAEQKTKLEQELATATAQASQLDAELVRLRADEQTAAQTHREAQESLAQAKKAVDDARRAKTGEPAAWEALKKVEAAARTAREAADKTKNLRGQTERQLRGPRGQIDSRTKALAKNADDTAKTAEKLAPDVAERDARAASTVEFQEQALAGQREVLQRLLARPENTEGEPAGTATPGKETAS